MLNRQVQTWLSVDEYEQLKCEWQEQFELRSKLKDKPSDLRRDEEKLREASFNCNRAEGHNEPPHLNWSSAMFGKRKTDNDEQTTTAGRDYHEVEAS